MTNNPTELVVTQALLPCPFCGNDGAGPIEDALQIAFCEHEWRTPSWSVQCDKCTANMGYSDSEAEAIAAWNHRLASTAPASEDEVERVARAIHEAEPTVGVSWADWIIYATAHPDHMRDVKHTRRQARAAIAALRPRSERGECICPKCGLRHGGSHGENAGF